MKNTISPAISANLVHSMTYLIANHGHLEYMYDTLQENIQELTEALEEIMDQVNEINDTLEELHPLFDDYEDSPSFNSTVPLPDDISNHSGILETER
ncbi:MAG: hypothetical protein IJ719_21680 [Clostridia bacterium]|nr:hypothetical protein [Clostridia bacterium]